MYCLVNKLEKTTMLLCDHALNMPVNTFINFILINLTSMMDNEVEIIKIAESLGC